MEHNGRPQHGANDDPAQGGSLGIFRQLPRQHSAAHVTGQNGTGKHGRIRPQKVKHRHHRWPQHRRQHRGKAYNAHHS